MGTQTRLRRSSGLSIVYVTLPWSRRVMAPPPCCGCGIVSLPVVWSLCPCHGLRVCGMVSLPVAWSPCPWRGLFAHGVVFVSVAWSLCPCHGLRVHGVVSLPVAWSPCPWRGLCACGVVSVAVFSICCITLGFFASYLPMGVFTPENRPAERILLHGSCHRYRLYGSHALY